MASKLNILTLLQQAKGLAQVTRRCPQPQRPSLVVLPAQPVQTTTRQRLAISVQVQQFREDPHPVEITRITGNPVPTGSSLA